MKKQVVTPVGLLVLMTLFTVSVAKAQSANQLKAKVPFAFNVGSRTLPAGEYEVTIVNPASDQKILRLRNTEQNEGAILQTHSVTGKSAIEAKLVFNRYADHYFLAQAWTGDDNIGLEAAKSRAEKAFRSRLILSERQTESIGLTRGQ